jgi:tRNA-dihydrouridine synthase
MSFCYAIDMLTAVDLNLGCPLKEAKSAGWGSWLLDEHHHPKVCDMVATCARTLRIPITVKVTHPSSSWHQTIEALQPMS